MRYKWFLFRSLTHLLDLGFKEKPLDPIYPTIAQLFTVVSLLYFW